MVKILSVASLFAAVATAQLDVHGLLNSLAPAKEGDPRFTNFVAPGPGDGKSLHRLVTPEIHADRILQFVRLAPD